MIHQIMFIINSAKNTLVANTTPKEIILQPVSVSTLNIHYSVHGQILKTDKYQLAYGRLPKNNQVLRNLCNTNN